MTHKSNEDQALDALFKTARDTSPELDEAFVARLMPETASEAPKQASRPFRLADWLPALGGLGMATALGVWIGAVVPVETLLNLDIAGASDALDLSAFYTGADPGLIFSDEAGL